MALKIFCYVILSSFIFLFTRVIKSKYKRSYENKIEVVIFIIVVIVFVTIMLELWEDLEKEALLDRLKVIAPIFTASLAVWAFSIAYLNYRRKSGAAFEYTLTILDSSLIKPYPLELSIFNLKDKSVVIYQIVMVVDNVAIECLFEAEALSAYSKKDIRINPIGFYCSNSDSQSYQRIVKVSYGMERLFESPALSNYSGDMLYERIQDNDFILKISTNFGDVIADRKSKAHIKSEINLRFLDENTLKQMMLDEDLHSIYRNPDRDDLEDVVKDAREKERSFYNGGRKFTLEHQWSLKYENKKYKLEIYKE